MSRTDKTAPYNVKFFYEPSYLQPIHNHEIHDCNLPPKPDAKHARNVQWQGHWDAPCFWWPTFEFYRSRWARCSCSVCGWDAFETPLRRRQRYDAKRYCRDGWRDEY